MHAATISTERKEAISRAACAVVRLAIDPDAAEPARRQNRIVNDVTAYTDREAWDAVSGLEDMVYTRGLQDGKEPKPVLKPGRLYLAFDRFVCESSTCAGWSARYSGQTIHGVPLSEYTDEDANQWQKVTGEAPSCECGAVTQRGSEVANQCLEDVYPCGECRAEVGEPCRPWCTARP